MKPDKLLDRMLAFANSPECPPHRKREVENGAWKTWADSITDSNAYSYSKVKHEKIKEYQPKYFTANNLQKYRAKLEFKKVINIKTGKVYSNSKEAANDTEYSTRLLTSFLNGTRLNKTDFLYFKNYKK